MQRLKSLASDVIICLTTVLLITGCSSSRENISPMPSISDEERAVIESPVNCANAEADIRILEEERASVGRRLMAGVRSVMPIAAVAGILMGDYSSRVEVATGDYNEAIDAKIRQIRTKCSRR